MIRVLLFLFYIALASFAHANNAYDLNVAEEELQIIPQESLFDDTSIVKIEDVSEIIKDKIFEKTDIEDKDNLLLQIRGHEKGLVINSKSDLFDVQISNQVINEKSKRFKFSIAFKSGDYSQDFDIYGKYDELVKLPVLRAKTPPNRVITRYNIRYVDFKKSKLRPGFITQEEQIVGKTLKRTIHAMKPLRVRDVLKPQLVSRNESVDVIYETDFMTLRTSAVAMENGGEDDFIRVKNLDSNKVFQARVQGANLVVVAANNSSANNKIN